MAFRQGFSIAIACRYNPIAKNVKIANKPRRDQLVSQALSDSTRWFRPLISSTSFESDSSEATQKKERTKLKKERKEWGWGDLNSR